MEQEPTTPRAPGAADGRYFLAVGGLLVLIVLLLGTLWMLERWRSADLLGQMAALQRNAKRRQAAEAALRQALQGGMMDARPLQRDDLPAETVTWNGRARRVLLIGADAGRRLGLRPGDVVAVASQPTSAPATQTAPAEP